MNDDEALQIEVYGRVQGVMFRQTVKDFCEEHGLKGHVMNREDGSVFIVVQGKRAILDEFLAWIRVNPGFSNVTGMAYTCINTDDSLREFSILKERNFIEDQMQSFKNLGKAMLGKITGKTPVHVAIIPDGNRRWAREQGFDASRGHRIAGEFNHLKSLMDEAEKCGVKYISFWGFSTENWTRDKIERDTIFRMIEDMIPRLREEFERKRVRFRHIGRKDRLPKSLVNALKGLEKVTEKNNSFFVQILLDYGGRDEIIRAVNLMIDKGEKVDENSFKSFLDTREIPDPDLVIRTSGEKRTSGLMPFQSTYAELYFSDVYFPDFDAKELRKAIQSFGSRVRRFGGTAKEDLQGIKVSVRPQRNI